MIAETGAARPALHPIHAMLLAFPIALFASAVASDVAYLRTAEMQWSNFSAWLIVGALVFGGLTGVCAIVRLAKNWRRADRRYDLIYVIALALAWLCGLINAFKHSQDAWSSVGGFGLTLTILSAALALIAGWFAHSSAMVRETL